MSNSLSRLDQIIKELRDFHHFEAADILQSVHDMEQRYEAQIARLEGRLADAWDEGFDSALSQPDDYPAAYLNPYREEK